MQLGLAENLAEENRWQKRFRNFLFDVNHHCFKLQFVLLSAQIHLELEHDKTSCPLGFFSFCSLLLGDNFQGKAAGFTLMEKSWSGQKQNDNCGANYNNPNE